MIRRLDFTDFVAFKENSRIKIENDKITFVQGADEVLGALAFMVCLIGFLAMVGVILSWSVFVFIGGLVTLCFGSILLAGYKMVEFDNISKSTRFYFVFGDLLVREYKEMFFFNPLFLIRQETADESFIYPLYFKELSDEEFLILHFNSLTTAQGFYNLIDKNSNNFKIEMYFAGEERI